MDHMMNIVTVGEREYLVDVGFAKHAPSSPLPLLDIGTVHATRHGEFRCDDYCIAVVK
jgi:arylamine N-acetyltransferase